MTVGEQFFLGLILLSFLAFGTVLAVVSASTNRHMRRGTAQEAGERARSSLKDVA